MSRGELLVKGKIQQHNVQECYDILKGLKNIKDAKQLKDIAATLEHHVQQKAPDAYYKKAILAWNAFLTYQKFFKTFTTSKNEEFFFLVKKGAEEAKEGACWVEVHSCYLQGNGVTQDIAKGFSTLLGYCHQPEMADFKKKCLGYLTQFLKKTNSSLPFACVQDFYSQSKLAKKSLEEAKENKEDKETNNFKTEFYLHELQLAQADGGDELLRITHFLLNQLFNYRNKSLTAHMIGYIDALITYINTHYKDKNDANSQLLRGIAALYHDKATSPLVTEAQALFEQATTTKTFLPAQYAQYFCYRYGLGIPPDHKKAVTILDDIYNFPQREKNYPSFEPLYCDIILQEQSGEPGAAVISFQQIKVLEKCKLIKRDDLLEYYSNFAKDEKTYSAPHLAFLELAKQALNHLPSSKISEACEYYQAVLTREDFPLRYRIYAAQKLQKLESSQRLSNVTQFLDKIKIYGPEVQDMKEKSCRYWLDNLELEGGFTINDETISLGRTVTELTAFLRNMLAYFAKNEDQPADDYEKIFATLMILADKTKQPCYQSTALQLFFLMIEKKHCLEFIKKEHIVQLYNFITTQDLDPENTFIDKIRLALESNLLKIDLDSSESIWEVDAVFNHIIALADYVFVPQHSIQFTANDTLKNIAQKLTSAPSTTTLTADEIKLLVKLEKQQQDANLADLASYLLASYALIKKPFMGELSKENTENRLKRLLFTKSHQIKAMMLYADHVVNWQKRMHSTSEQSSGLEWLFLAHELTPPEENSLIAEIMSGDHKEKYTLLQPTRKEIKAQFNQLKEKFNGTGTRRVLKSLFEHLFSDKTKFTENPLIYLTAAKAHSHIITKLKSIWQVFRGAPIAIDKKYQFLSLVADLQQQNKNTFLPFSVRWVWSDTGFGNWVIERLVELPTKYSEPIMPSASNPELEDDKLLVPAPLLPPSAPLIMPSTTIYPFVPTYPYLGSTTTTISATVLAPTSISASSSLYVSPPTTSVITTAPLSFIEQQPTMLTSTTTTQATTSTTSTQVTELPKGPTVTSQSTSSSSISISHNIASTFGAEEKARQRKQKGKNKTNSERPKQLVTYS